MKNLNCEEEFKLWISTAGMEMRNIDNYNIAVYYMTPQYLKLCYEEGEIIE